MKLVTDLKENEVIHCPTLEEAEAICRLMDGAGLRWRNGVPYSKITNWAVHKRATCYNPSKGTYSTHSFYVDEGYTIHKASEFLTETK